MPRALRALRTTTCWPWPQGSARSHAAARTSMPGGAQAQRLRYAARERRASVRHSLTGNQVTNHQFYNRSVGQPGLSMAETRSDGVGHS